LTQVYVGNLPLDVDRERIGGVISENGGDGYMDFRLGYDKGKFRGFCYIDYEDKEKAQAVVEAMNGIEVDGRTIKADIAIPRGERISKDHNLYIGNLNFESTSENVLNMVNEVIGEGKCVDVRIITDKYTQKSRGFGYLTFTDTESAENALEELNGLSLDGRKVRVDRANRNQSAERRVSERDNRNTIFLGNLSWDVTADLLEDMLNDLLGPNQFLKVRVNIDKETGRMRGFAHVDFVDEEATERALTELDGIELLGRALRVDRAKRSDESKKPSSDDLQP